MARTPTIDDVVEKVNSYLPNRDGAVIRHAYEVAAKAHAGQKRDDNSPYITHCLATADILAVAVLRLWPRPGRLPGPPAG